MKKNYSKVNVKTNFAFPRKEKMIVKLMYFVITHLPGLYRRNVIVKLMCFIITPLRSLYRRRLIVKLMRYYSFSRLIVTKEGPTKGRIFFKCNKMDCSDRCKFFEWADETGEKKTGE